MKKIKTLVLAFILIAPAHALAFTPQVCSKNDLAGEWIVYINYQPAASCFFTISPSLALVDSSCTPSDSTSFVEVTGKLTLNKCKVAGSLAFNTGTVYRLQAMQGVFMNSKAAITGMIRNNTRGPGVLFNAVRLN